MVTGSPANVVDRIVYTTPEDLEKKLHKSLETVLPRVRSWKDSTLKLRTQTGLGTRLRELRQRCGYATSGELASALGMSPHLLGLVEAGDFENLGIQLLERICNALEVSLPEVLAGGELPVAQRERDPNLLRLEDIARRLNWPVREFFALRDDYARQLAAKGESESISEDQWLKRRDALERRTLDATKIRAGSLEDQPRLL
jgi:transcriptional regulator with XRE-family HTH domain